MIFLKCRLIKIVFNAYTAPPKGKAEEAIRFQKFRGPCAGSREGQSRHLF